MFHLIRKMLYQQPIKSDGKFEVDKTFVGGKHSVKTGRGSENKTAVFGLVLLARFANWFTNFLQIF